MPLLDHFELVILNLQFKQRDLVTGDELSRDGAASEVRVLLRAPRRVLSRLHGGNLVLSTLGLDRDDVVATVLVQPDVQLIDLDLANALDAGSQVVLQ